MIQTGLTNSHPNKTMLTGIDVSEWQGAIAWQQVSQQNIVFAFIKATEAVSYTDKFAIRNCKQAEEAGLYVGIYHFFRAAADPTDQANHFLSVSQTLKVTNRALPPVLDLEDNGGNNPVVDAELQQKVQRWLDLVAQETDRQPIIYVSPYFWNTHMRGFDTSRYLLWIANYRVQQPSLPSGWSRWTFWQYSNSRWLNGISGPVDMDLFNGNAEALSALS